MGESSWRVGDSNLSRLDAAINNVEGILRQIYAGKPYLYLGKVSSGKSGYHLVLSDDNNISHRLQIRVSRATSIELIDIQDICIKIPLQESLYEKLQSIDHFIFLSNKKRRYEGRTEIIIIDARRMLECITLVHGSTKESLESNGYKVLRGYLVMPLTWFQESELVVGHYVDVDPTHYMSIDSGEVFPKLKSKYLAWSSFKLLPYSLATRPITLVDVNTKEILRYSSTREAMEKLHVSKVAVSRAARVYDSYKNSRRSLLANGNRYIVIYDGDNDSDRIKGKLDYFKEGDYE